jgi:hypothetical protein
MTTCQTCTTEFTPRRSTARYCSNRCRLTAHRARLDSVSDAPHGPSDGVYSAETLRNDRRTTPGPERALETLIPPTSRTLPKGIVQDGKYPSMYRLIRPDGGLSDMVNLTRAKDALLRSFIERTRG